MYDHDAIKIYTDGSAPHNPGQGGAAFIVEFPDALGFNNKQFKRGYIESTNNRMELIAVLEALRYLKKLDIGMKKRRAIIVTDSDYVYSGHNDVNSWQGNGWQTQSGFDVQNRDLWREYLSLRRNVAMNFRIEWARGKSTEILKEVDKLAKHAASYPTYKDLGYQPGRVSRSKVKDGKLTTTFPNTGEKKIIHVYGYKPISKETGLVKFDMYSEEGKKFISKHQAYLQSELKHGLHRNHCYTASFKKNARSLEIESLKQLELCPSPVTD